MDVGVTHDNRDWEYSNWNEEEINAIGYYGYRWNGKANGKGKGGTQG